MSKDKYIEVSIQRLAGTYLKDIISIYACNVDSVDDGGRTCDCTPIGGDANTSLPGVLLCAENNNGFIIFPSVNSTVIVALSTRNTAFVLMYSDIDKVQFMDGSLGGMVITPKLVTRLNDIENKVNAIITWGASVTPPLATSPLIPTVSGDIENTLITQGINPP